MGPPIYLPSAPLELPYHCAIFHSKLTYSPARTPYLHLEPGVTLALAQSAGTTLDPPFLGLPSRSRSCPACESPACPHRSTSQPACQPANSPASRRHIARHHSTYIHTNTPLTALTAPNLPVWQRRMQFFSASSLLLAAGLFTSAIAHNIQLPAHGRECFHEILHRDDKMTVSFQVGDREFGGAGNLEIDFWVR